jgi:hypothetical protein
MIKRAPRANHYTMLNTETFSIPMSAECLGVYLYLLSKPDHWSVSPVQLAKRFDCSNDRIYRILKDLLAVTHDGQRLLVKSGQTKKGVKGFATTDYTVNEPTAKTAFIDNADALEYSETLASSKLSISKEPACRDLSDTLKAYALNPALEITDCKKQLSIETKRNAVPAEVYQLGIDAELWNEYMATRKRAKATSTPRAIKTLINKIASLAAVGHNPVQLVEEANANGWKSVYPRTQEDHTRRTASQLATNNDW